MATLGSHSEPSPLAPRIKALRTEAGLTIRNAASQATVGLQTWRRWEQGTHAPQPHRLGQIARALGCPVAALFAPDGYVAVTDVQLTPEAVAAVRRLGAVEAERLAQLIAAQLPALILATCRTSTRPSGTARGKPRRTRAEVLAGIQQANQMRAAKAARPTGTPKDSSARPSGGLPGALTAE